MDNELIVKRSWWRGNRKCFLPLSGFILIAAAVAVSGIDGVTDFAQSYADSSLCQDAINAANKNEQVVQSLGTLEPIDNLAIMEGNSVYSNNNNTVNITVRVKGAKGKAKMDIIADKTENKWKYRKIKIRIKQTGEAIEVLNR